MDVKLSSATVLPKCQITWRHFPEDLILHDTHSKSPSTHTVPFILEAKYFGSLYQARGRQVQYRLKLQFNRSVPALRTV